MNLSMLLPQEAKRILRARLLGEWVIVTGDPDMASRLEYEVYEPGTPANNDFEILVAITKDHKILPIVHVRKTQALRKLLALDDLEWSELFEVRLVDTGTEGTGAAHVFGARTRDARREWVDAILEVLA